jgi:hypothetical protein
MRKSKVKCDYFRPLDFNKYLQNAEMELEYRKISKKSEKIVEKILSN